MTLINVCAQISVSEFRFLGFLLLCFELCKYSRSQFGFLSN